MKVIMMVVLGLLIESAVYAGPVAEREKLVLAGLPGVQVVVEQLPPAVEGAGLTHRQLLTDVELRLRNAGVRILTRDERAGTDRQAFLYVNLQVAMNRPEEPMPPYFLIVELRERVLLFSDVKLLNAVWGRVLGDRSTTQPSSELVKDAADDRAADVCFSAATWRSSGAIGRIPVARLRDLRQSVADEVDQFINEYLGANPKNQKERMVPAPTTRPAGKGRRP